MVFGTLSNLGRAQKLMRETDLDAARIASLADFYGFSGLSESSLSRALKTGKLGFDADKYLGVLVGKLEGLINDVAPLAISFSNPERVAQLINDIETRRIVFVILSGLEPVEPGTPE